MLPFNVSSVGSFPFAGANTINRQLSGNTSPAEQRRFLLDILTAAIAIGEEASFALAEEAGKHPDGKDPQPDRQ